MQLNDKVQHVYLVGAKSLGAYGGYETFVYKLTEYHQNNEHHRQEIIKSICPSKQLQSLQKSEETYHSIPSINTPIKALYNPIITHPEERIWAGRKPRVPDAPKIKHDKMKQFYMVDMGRKM